MKFRRIRLSSFDSDSAQEFSAKTIPVDWQSDFVLIGLLRRARGHFPFHSEQRNLIDNGSRVIQSIVSTRSTL